MRRRRRAAAALLVQLAGALPVAALAGAAAARSACACGGASAYDIYQPYGDLAGLVDAGADDDGYYETPVQGPQAARYSFLAPWVIADSAGDAAAPGRAVGRPLARLLAARFAWQPDSAGPPALSDAAFAAALGAGALDRAAAEARALVAASLAIPAGEAQAAQGVVRRTVEFLELRPALGGTSGPLLARFFAAVPAGAPRPYLVCCGPDSAASRARLAAWERAQRRLALGQVPNAELPPLLRAAAELRGRSRDALAAAGAAPAPTGEDPAAVAARLRRPSLRYVALERRTQALVPDGWPDPDTLAAVAPRFRALRREYAAWLADYPGHPLAPLVRLGTVRVDRFAQDTARAWATLLAEYRAAPARRARAVAEMNHLLMVDVRPRAATLAAVDAGGDPLLRSALVFRRLGCDGFACADGSASGYARPAWDAAWRAAEAARPAAWAVNAQERLLRAAVGDTLGGPLPPAFPARAEAPTPLWGLLRLALLVRAERWADAEAQAALLPRGRSAAGLRARLALRRGAWSRALGDPELHPDARLYLVRVLAPDSVLAVLAASPDTGVRATAVRAQAARRAGAAGDWAGGARLLAAVDSAAAARYARAAALAADATPAGREAWGEFLVAQQDSLLGGDERAWYRSLEGRWEALGALARGGRGAGRARPVAVAGVPWTPAGERAAIGRFLRTHSELYLALGAYARAAAALPPGPARAAAARAGDVPYNRLRNRNYEYTAFWRRALAGDPAVAALRRAGR